METIKLRNGTEEVAGLVTMVSLTVRELFDNEPIVAYELAMKARDQDHECFGNSGDKLIKLALMNADGSMHDSVRNIVLSMFQGEGLNIALVSPVE